MTKQEVIEYVTTEKAIEMLKLFRNEFDVDSKCQNARMFDVSIFALEENDKLKEEIKTLNFIIKDLKCEIDQFEKINKCQANFITKFKKEVIKLKETISKMETTAEKCLNRQ